jgi:UDP-3-O-[3-hydroxymyristoyl] glucosamine N-acyltransferase
VNTTVDALAALVGGQVEGGDGQMHITGIAAISEAMPGQLTFFGNTKYLPALKQSRASAALVPLDFNEEIAPIKIKVASPSLAFARILDSFAPAAAVHEPGIHPTAVIGENVAFGENVSVQPYAVIESGARIGAGAFIGAHVFIGADVTVGERCKIHPHVTLREGIILGARVVIHSGSVIGSDGFGYEFSNGKHVKIPQIGIVQIDDDVEIGANVTIDRARFGRTWIGEGTKIDNLVQVAHNVVVGKHCILVAGVAIAGSTRLGNYVTLAGQVGVAGHLEIGDGAMVGAQSGIGKNIPPKTKWFSSPAIPFGEYGRRTGYINRLSKLFARVKKLEQVLGDKGISLPPET